MKTVNKTERSRPNFNLKKILVKCFYRGIQTFSENLQTKRGTRGFSPAASNFIYTPVSCCQFSSHPPVRKINTTRTSTCNVKWKNKHRYSETRASVNAGITARRKEQAQKKRWKEWNTRQAPEKRGKERRLHSIWYISILSGECGWLSFSLYFLLELAHILI